MASQAAVQLRLHRVSLGNQARWTSGAWKTFRARRSSLQRVKHGLDRRVLDRWSHGRRCSWREVSRYVYAVSGLHATSMDRSVRDGVPWSHRRGPSRSFARPQSRWRDHSRRVAKGVPDVRRSRVAEGWRMMRAVDSRGCAPSATRSLSAILSLCSTDGILPRITERPSCCPTRSSSQYAA